MLSFSFLLFVCTCLPFLANSSSYSATFTSGNTGIIGTVTVDNGYVSVMLNVSDASLTEACHNGSYTYHLHTMWEHSNSADRIGSTDCAKMYTGNHYDPYRACSSASANIYCSNNEGGCILTSDYSCDFSASVYSCEMGDWSGKYGSLMEEDGVLMDTGSSFYEVDGADVMNMSVVFHCDGERAFCAPFMMDSTSMYDTHAMQTSTMAPLGLEVDLGDYGSISLALDGTYTVDDVDIGSLNISCSYGVVEYAIFNKRENGTGTIQMGNDLCSLEVMSQWDPTNQCSTEWSDSEYCLSGDGDGTVICNDTDTDTSSSSEYDAPGALSSVYGTVSTMNDSLNEMLNYSAILPMFDLIYDKVVVFYCQDDWMMELCAPISVVTAPATSPTTKTPTEETDGGSMVRSGVIVLVVGLIAMVIGN